MGTGVMPSLWETIDSLVPPTLAIAGSTDEKFRDIAREMTLRNARIEAAVPPDAGHCAHLENPAAVGALIEGFIERHEPRGSTS
jgi:2-succinyl-6-hydroxy-2,4-cyclohexadiene-1-carboxylate synthase